jgi:imidazolonepropionase-like amidohydrolase
MMRYGGLTEDEALKTITYNGALQLGVQDHVGSIEVGKDADVVISSGDPLSVYSSAETTFIDGEIFFDKQRDLAMRDQMAKERAALEAAERGRRTTPVIP